MKRLIQFPFPVFITVEGRWFVAGCPVLNLATQGKTEKEVKDNMADLIKDYLNDPDTVKPQLNELASSSLSFISVPVSEGLLYG